MGKKEAQTTAIRLPGSARPKSPMDEAYAYAYAPNGDLFLPFLLVLRGADSEDDLSKYVMYSHTRNTRQNYKISGTYENELTKKWQNEAFFVDFNAIMEHNYNY